MGHYILTEITCDWPGCYARARNYGPKLTDARKKAADHGWKNVASLLDFCGTKEQAEPYSDDGASWGGHAGREDHMPIVKNAAKGRVTLACLCGWKYVGEYSWEGGTVYRGGAIFRWGNHMREVIAAEKKAAAALRAERGDAPA